jgi:hypothetical protein
MSAIDIEDLLILAKTYPYPSSRHRETTCVAAMNRDGALRRVFPVPFRLLEGEQQFQKWEWIRAQVKLPGNDRRPESRRVDIDTILRLNERVGTERGWEARKRLVEPHILDNFDTLEQRRQTTGETLGFYRPSRLLGLDVTAVRETEWTKAEVLKLLQEGLFDSEEVKSRPPLEKLGHDFHYRYECILPDGTVKEHRHKIIDWEAGQLYRRCRREYNHDWELAFRKKYETEFATKDLIFMMGTIHRFPDQWLIIGVLYPPMPSPLPPQLLLEI